MNAEAAEVSTPQEERSTSTVKGDIHSYNRARGYGFLSGTDGNQYFFHISAVSEGLLEKELERLAPGGYVPVTFEPGEGPRGRIALSIRSDWNPDELFSKAMKCAEAGEYNSANHIIKLVLAKDRNYPGAEEAYAGWKVKAKLECAPKADNIYALAKQAHWIDREYETALRLYRDAISSGVHTQSAIKDAAMLLAETGCTREAIEFLEQHRYLVRDQLPIVNLLIPLYKREGNHAALIQVSRAKLVWVSKKSERATVYFGLGRAHQAQGDFQAAVDAFTEGLKLDPDDVDARISLAEAVVRCQSTSS